MSKGMRENVWTCVGCVTVRYWRSLSGQWIRFSWMGVPCYRHKRSLDCMTLSGKPCHLEGESSHGQECSLTSSQTGLGYHLRLHSELQSEHHMAIVIPANLQTSGHLPPWPWTLEPPTVSLKVLAMGDKVVTNLAVGFGTPAVSHRVHATPDRLVIQLQVLGTHGVSCYPSCKLWDPALNPRVVCHPGSGLQYHTVHPTPVRPQATLVMGARTPNTCTTACKIKLRVSHIARKSMRTLHPQMGQ